MLVGWTCPPWTPTAGNQNAPEHCVGACPHQCVSPLLLHAMWKLEHENHHKGGYISASLLTESPCARQTYYERREPFYEMPTKRFWPFRGTVIHKIIETAGVGELVTDGWIQELRMSVDLEYPDLPQPKFDENGEWHGEFEDRPLVVTLGGTCDGYNLLTRELHDFKSMADAKVEMFAKAEEAEEKHEIQLNVYRWLISRTKVSRKLRKQFPDLPKYLPPPEKLIIQAIGMMAIPRSGRSFGMKLSVPGKRRKEYTEMDIPEIPVWPLERTEEFIRGRVLEWYRYLVMGVKPPVATEENKWICGYCAFNGEAVENGPCFPTAERAATSGD